MPEPTGRGSREFLTSANQALAELEQTTGKPVLIVDAPELNVLATIRRAGPEDSSHVLRSKGGSRRVADNLIVMRWWMVTSRPQQNVRDVSRSGRYLIQGMESTHTTSAMPRKSLSMVCSRAC